MPFATAASYSIMSLLFNATSWAFIAQNNATTPDASFGWSLMTADPTSGGNMSSNETTYTNYARAFTGRTTGAGGMTVVNNVCSPQANVSFTQSAGAAGAITFFAIGRPGAAGTSVAIHMSGSVTPSITITNGVTPILTTATTFTLT